jgi:hypothetical protein
LHGEEPPQIVFDDGREPIPLDVPGDAVEKHWYFATEFQTALYSKTGRVLGDDPLAHGEPTPPPPFSRSRPRTDQ